MAPFHGTPYRMCPRARLSHRRAFRAPDCARTREQAQGARLPSVSQGVFRTGAKQETKQPADAASSCPILPQFSQGQPRNRNYLGFFEQTAILGHGLDPAIPPATAGLASGRSPRPHGFGRGPPDTTPKSGRPDRHPYDLFLKPAEIEHRTARVRRPQSNAFVQRLNRTLLDEHFRIMGRTKLYNTSDAYPLSTRSSFVREAEIA